MAKRKRLNPAATEAGHSAPTAPARAAPRVPIAEISGDASMRAAFDEVAGELAAARREGRMVMALPLGAVVADHLIRDRLDLETDEMDSLRDSLRARGQQTPIEVQDLGQGRYGLISGWRRLTALRRLQETTGDARFTTVQALVRRPDSAPDAYLAMVEENEIRADLSFYERARISVQAVRAGVFADVPEAVRTLFAAAQAPKRSKIVAFTALVEAFDDMLRFPAAIPEKLGLALAIRLQKDAGFRTRLLKALRDADVQDAGAERAVLDRAVRGSGKSRPAKRRGAEIAPGLCVDVSARGVLLSGPRVDAPLIEDLRAWLAQRARS